MKKHFLLYIVLTTLVSLSQLSAQNKWATAKLIQGQYQPIIKEYWCSPEIGSNGTMYLRLLDANCGGDYRPNKLQYGYKSIDRKIYIYDFETEEERLAFDFTLAEGDLFETYNGIEWIVESVSDTLVNFSYMELGDKEVKRLLSVRSIDGRYSDKWLEDVGSLSNHFMILPMTEQEQYFTLWVEFNCGSYFINELSSDPLFTHDFGYPAKYPEIVYDRNSCSYSDGSVKVEYLRWSSVNREYMCFCRKGNDFYKCFVWSLSPAVETCQVIEISGEFVFEGLPAPIDGEYVLHFDRIDKPTEVYEIPDGPNNDISPISYDIWGRKRSSSSRGIVIVNGQKIYVSPR